MSIVRTVKRENPFVQIDKTCFEDTSLSWRAKGLLGYMLSRPPGWTIRKDDLIKRSSDGKTVVEGALLDLMEAGYIYYFADRDEEGKIKEWVYEVYESPDYNPNKEKGQAKAKELKQNKKEQNKKKNDKRLHTDNKAIAPETDNPEVDNLKVDNPPYNNNDFKKNKRLKNNDIYISPSGSSSSPRSPRSKPKKDKLPPWVEKQSNGKNQSDKGNQLSPEQTAEAERLLRELGEM